ncbi:hypothetical protein VKT23_009469 [Stygiomarasmius scandens]|uniref:Uncharacterized protein n=1 Tax=Marasmiellus scandens TaxID=2682957 RepID=A0ABR1JII2_9AGAR
MHLRSRTIQTPYTDVSVPPVAAPPRSRKRMILDCIELPSASTHRKNSAPASPVDPVDKELSVSSGPNTTATASHSSTPTDNVRPVPPKQPGPDLVQLANQSPQQPATTRQFVQDVPGLVKTVDRNGKVMIDFSQVRNTTWFDLDRARRQRQAQEPAAQPARPSDPPAASTSRRQLTPVADEDLDFPWDARDEHINELNRRSDRTPLKQRLARLPPSSPPPSPPSPHLPHVSSPVQGEVFGDDPEAVERGKGKSVAFADDADFVNETVDEEAVIDDDDGSSDDYSDGLRQEQGLREQKKARLDRQRQRKRNHSSQSSRAPGPIPAPKQPSKRGRKPKNPIVTEAPANDDASNDDDDLPDPVLDPDCPEYEPEAEVYDTPGPLSNECRRELEAATYEFETRLHELSRKYQKSVSSLHQAAGYGFKSHRKDSTWNDYQAFRTKMQGEKQRPNESLQAFVGRLASEYKAVMKLELGENWKNIDRRRELAKRKGWVGFAQQLREDMASDERQNGVKSVTVKRCIDEVMKVAHMCYSVFGLIVCGQIHDLNNHNRSRLFGWGGEYDTMMSAEKTFLTKDLKSNAAKLRTYRDKIQAGLEEDPVKSQLLQEYNSGPNKVAVLRPLLPKLLKLDLAEATDNVVKNMKWKSFLSVARSHQVRLIDYPTGVPAIGPKSKGLISHAKDLSLGALQAMIDPRMRHYKALHTPPNQRNEDECDAALTTFRGTRIITWTDEEKGLPLEEQGEIALIVDVEGKSLMTVEDAINFENDEGEEGGQDGQPDAAEPKGKSKGKSKEVVSDEEDSESEEDEPPSIEPEPEAHESIYRTLPFSGKRVFTTPERLARMGQARTPLPSSSRALPVPKSIPRRPATSVPSSPVALRQATTFKPRPPAPSRPTTSTQPHATKGPKRKPQGGAELRSGDEHKLKKRRV